MRILILSALLLASAVTAARAGAEQEPPAVSEPEPAAEPEEQDAPAKPNRKRPPSARNQPANRDAAPNAEQSDDAEAVKAGRRQGAQQKRDDENAARDRARAEAQAKRDAEQAKQDAEAEAQREAERAKKDGEAQAQREADKAKRDAEAQQKRDDEDAARDRARAEAQAKRDAEQAKQDAEAQAQREAERAKKDGEAQAQREADKARRDAEAQAKRDAEQAKQEAEAQAKQDADKSKEASEVPAKGDADRAARRSKRQEQRGEKTDAGPQEPPPATETVPAQQVAPDQRPAEPDRSDAPASNTHTPPTNGAPAGNGPGRPALMPNAEQGPSTNPGNVERKVIPAEAAQAKEMIREERLNADAEFQRAKKDAEAAPARGARPDNPRLDVKATARFENVRKQRRERVEQGGIAIIEEPGQRTIVRQKDRIAVRHDDGRRLQRTAREARREKRSDGTTLIVNIGLGGLEIYTVEDQYGRLVRRSRRDRQGREVVLIDNRDYYRRHRDRGFIGATVNLGPLRLAIPRKRYIVEYDDVSEDELYETLWAPPVERLDRGYSLEEVRYSHQLRQRMRRVDLDAITFAFASWEVDESQYRSLERMARVMKRILDRHPDEIFLIEGHTDAVGSEIDNLSLSDRRAESVAIILADEFQVPAENLTTQGYGEQYLKEATYGPSRINRRVAVRRITPLLYSGRGSERRR